MARIGIAITKRVVFRDSTQEFSNVYYFEAASNTPDAPTANAFIDEVANGEKGIHGSPVSFIHGRCWSAGGTPAQNHMISEKPLTGVGTLPADNRVDKERAILIQWPAGVDSRGKQVNLRKWYHICATMSSGQAWTDPILSNAASMPSTERTEWANRADVLTRIGSLEAWGLVAESGRTRDGGAPSCHRYLEHHQLGDQWRG